MNYKIKPTAADYPDVIIFWLLVDDKIVVNILAYGTKEDADMYGHEQINMPTIEHGQDFIKDFTTDSANNFCRRNQLRYHK